jgi:hypothetical protein
MMMKLIVTNLIALVFTPVVTHDSLTYVQTLLNFSPFRFPLCTLMYYASFEYKLRLCRWYIIVGFLLLEPISFLQFFLYPL